MEIKINGEDIKFISMKNQNNTYRLNNIYSNFLPLIGNVSWNENLVNQNLISLDAFEEF